MSTPEVDPVVGHAAGPATDQAADATAQPHEPTVVAEHEVEVDIVRSVRYGRILIGFAILGAALASLASLFFPIEVGADYTMSQIAGFMLLIGAIIGLALGAVLSLILTAAAKRRHGSAVAIQSDVR